MQEEALELRSTRSGGQTPSYLRYAACRKATTIDGIDPRSVRRPTLSIASRARLMA